MSSETLTPKPGQWVLTGHWRGPFCRVDKVTAKRIAVDGHGYIEPQDVRAVFDTREDALAGHQAYQASWKAAQEELQPLREARSEATQKLVEAERRLRAKAWSDAAAAKAEAQS